MRSGAHCPSRHEDVTRRHRGDDGARAMSRMVAWTYPSLGHPHRELALGRPRPRVPVPTPQREGWHCGFLYRSWQWRRSLFSVPMSRSECWCRVRRPGLGLVSRAANRQPPTVAQRHRGRRFMQARYRRARNSMCSSSTAVSSMSEALALRGACGNRSPPSLTSPRLRARRKVA